LPLFGFRRCGFIGWCGFFWAGARLRLRLGRCLV
jgi:hypothetical protein